MMRTHQECKKRCQYARDVGRPEDHCALSCVYQDVADEHTKHVKRMSNGFYVMIGVAAAAALTAAIVLGVIGHG